MKYVEYQVEIFDICTDHVDEAVAKGKDSNDTVIAKQVRTCGKESAVHLMMGIDGLQGIDTTGNRAPFILHLADNSNK